jgi:transcriptional regulator with XRE-family HTH domain
MKTKIWPYPVPESNHGDNMAKRKYRLPEIKEPFSQRLTRIRKAAGLTQLELAQHLGISQRMVAYYENETTHPPTHLLPAIAKVLGVTTDQLLGVEKVKEVKRRDTRLRRKIEEVEKLPDDKRKQIVQYLDTFLDREKLLQEKQKKG